MRFSKFLVALAATAILVLAGSCGGLMPATPASVTIDNQRSYQVTFFIGSYNNTGGAAQSSVRAQGIISASTTGTISVTSGSSLNAWYRNDSTNGYSVLIDNSSAARAFTFAAGKSYTITLNSPSGYTYTEN